MIEQVNNAVKFLAFFVASKVGKTGLADVTVDVYDPAGSLVANGAAASEIGGGLYSYELAANQVSAVGEYPAVFKTADATVDAQHVPSLWVVGRAGLENLDVGINTRLATADFDLSPVTDALGNTEANLTVVIGSAESNLSTVVGSTEANLVVVIGSTEANLAVVIANTEANLALTITDPLDNLVPGAYAAGTAGAALGRIGVAEITAQVPAGSSGLIELMRGDDYLLASGRHIIFTGDSWPDLTSADPIEMTIRRRREAFGTGSDGVLVNVEDVANSRVVGVGNQTVVFELTSTDTAALLPGEATGKYDIQATFTVGNTSEIITLATGIINVTEDQTR